MQMKVQKQQSTAHNSKNDTWTTAEYEKSHQNTAGTQNDTTSPRAIRLKPTTSTMFTKGSPCYFSLYPLVNKDPYSAFL